MLKITPIGSCRISTPLREGEKTYGFKRNLDGIYGFSHSSAEAVQQAKFLKREYTPNEAVWPLIAPKQSMSKLLEKPHEESDLYIVELSSTKRIFIGKECIQINYLYRRYEDFFSDKERTRAFWALATSGDQNKIDAFIGQSGVDLPQADFDLIRQLRYGLTTQEELRTDLRFLLDAFPEVLFVTHVDAATENGNLIESRSNFISMVKSAVKAEGGIVYDPTEFMREYGQKLAIEDHSTGLAHFTQGFSAAMFAQWYNQHIFPLVERMAYTKKTDQTRSNLERGLQGLLQIAPISQVQRHVVKAIDELGQSPELIRIQTHCLAQIGDVTQKMDLLRAGLHDFPDDLKLLEQFISLAKAQHCGLEAFGFVQQYLNHNQYLSSTVLLTLAEALEAEQHLKEALECILLANTAMPEYPQIVEQLARLALVLGDEKAINLCKSILTQTTVFIDSILTTKILLWNTQTDDFKDYLHKIGGIPLHDFFPVLTFLDDHGQENQIARAIAAYASFNPDILNHVVTKRIFDKWKANLNSELSRAKQLALINQILHINPDQRAANAALKTIRREILLQVRELIKVDDIATIETLREEVAMLTPPLVEFDLYRSRHYFKCKNWEMALQAAQNILRTTPDHAISWLTVMRCAIHLENYVLVDIAAQEFISLAGVEREKQKIEAQNRLSQLPKLSMKAARIESDPFKAWQLAKICARNESLLQKAEQIFRINEKKLVALTREMADASHEAFPQFVDNTLKLLPENEPVLRAAATYFTAQNMQETALPYWERLLKLRPNDTQIAAQIERCQRLAPLAKAS